MLGRGAAWTSGEPGAFVPFGARQGVAEVALHGRLEESFCAPVPKLPEGGEGGSKLVGIQVMQLQQESFGRVGKGPDIIHVLEERVALRTLVLHNDIRADGTIAGSTLGPERRRETALWVLNLAEKHAMVWDAR